MTRQPFQRLFFSTFVCFLVLMVSFLYSPMAFAESASADIQQTDNNQIAAESRAQTKGGDSLSGSVASVAAGYVDQDRLKSDDIIQKYEVNRLSFSHKQKKLNAIIASEGKVLDEEIVVLEEKIIRASEMLERKTKSEPLMLPENLTQTLQDLDEKLSVNGLLLRNIRIFEVVSSICLFPEFLLLIMLFGSIMTPYAPGFGGVLFSALITIDPESQKSLILVLYLGLPVLVFNIFLFLFLRHRELFDRYKKVIAGGFILLLSSSIILSSVTFGGKGVIIFWICSVFIAMGYLAFFLFLKKRELIHRYKFQIIFGLLAFLMLYATSLIAGQQEKIQQVEERLDYTVQLLGLSDYAKAIAMLEAKMSDTVQLSATLAPGDPLLAISTVVRVDTPNYYITLASLLIHENKSDLAMNALSQLSHLQKSGGRMSEESIVNTVRFLITSGHKSIAAEILQTHRKEISSVSVLLDMIPFLETHGMPLAAENLLKAAIDRAGSTREYLLLVDYFYQDFKQDKAELYLKKAMASAETIGHVYRILLIAKEHNAPPEIAKFDDKIKKLHGSVENFLLLAAFLEKEGQSAKVSILLKRSIRQAKNENDLRQIAMAAVGLNHDEVFPRIQERIFQVADTPLDSIGFVDFLLDENRTEEGSALFAAIAERTLKRSKDKSEQTLLLLRLAMERKLLKEAAQLALRRIANLKTAAFNVSVHIDYPFAAQKGLPDPEQISLPLFYGLINEELGEYDRAEKMYISAVLRTLNRVVTSSGQALPDSLNEFYLLGNMWIKGGKTELLSKLDRAYSILEVNVLKQKLQKKREALLAERLEKAEILRGRLQKLEKENEQKNTIAEERDRQQQLHREEQLQKLISEAEDEIVSKQKTLQNSSSRLHWLLPAVVVMFVTIIMLMLGCVVLSWQHAKRCSGQRVYAWFVRFFELNGWVRIFSVFGVISGLLLVFVSQLWQFPQGILENMKRSKTVDPE